MAVRDGLYDNTKLFLEAGADLELGRDMFGRSAVDLIQFIIAQRTVRFRPPETHEEAYERYLRVQELVLVSRELQYISSSVLMSTFLLPHRSSLRLTHMA